MTGNLATDLATDQVTLCDGERRAFRPPENLTVSQWAAKYRIVIDGDFRGKWRPDLAPFCNEPMDCFNLPWVQAIILDWPPQVAKTQIGFNWLCYAADQDPGPAMYAMPGMFECGRLSSKRLIPTLRATPRIAALLSPQVDDTSTFYINLTSMPIMMAWTGSAAVISSEPVRILICDEVEKYPSTAGAEGMAPLDLLVARTKAYPFTKKMLFASTCANQGGNMDRLINELADETRDYCVVCPACGERQIMHIDSLSWPGGNDADPRVIERRRVAWYSCAACGVKWDNAMRDAAVRHPDAAWLPRTPVPDGKPRVIHYHLPSWVVPSTPLSEVAAAFLRSRDDPSAKRTFITQHAAEPYVDTIAKKIESELAANRTGLPPLVCPGGTIGVTMFIDPGMHIFWYGACAWRRDMSAHLVQYGYVNAWDEVRALIHDSMYTIDGEPETFLLPVWRAGLDTGGGRAEDAAETMTEEAYDFIRRHGGGKLVGTKGKDARYWQSGRKIHATVIDRTPRKKPIPGGINLWVLNVDAFKDAVHYRLSIDEGLPGRLTFHADTGDDFFRQVVAEEKKRDKYGRQVWTQVGKQNHYLDVLVGNFALADPEASGGIRVKAPPRAPQPTSETPPPPYIPNYAARHRESKGGGFVNRFKRR